ncbi:squalene cyclase [Arthrobacter sp. SX1312]|uniref:squalene cyclase n=1 Tax=Arthrobacter sp. SX1312 TaxID=2058896 RepID=UPI000CE517B0|nr:squalene cyclase [Arthrobacter sp. SX1312]
MALDGSLIDWLLTSDPALRWQVERDLAGAPEEAWMHTRDLVATEGFGARLLAHQDADGQWAGGAFFPAGFDLEGPEAAASDGQPWTATTWSLTSLRQWGLDADALGDTAERLRVNSRWEYDDLPYWGGEVDACINGMTLANGAWLGLDMGALAEWFVDHQVDEGGWNCAWVEGLRRASFPSTLSALDGVLDYEILTGGSPPLTAARHAAEEYLLRRRLLYRLGTGEPVAAWIGAFAYPFRSYYSALRALDYFRRAAEHDGAAPDHRLEDAVELVRTARQPDGTWLQQRRHPGEAWFDVDVPAGVPSPWVTFHAARVLHWWDSARGPAEGAAPSRQGGGS